MWFLGYVFFSRHWSIGLFNAFDNVNKIVFLKNSELDALLLTYVNVLIIKKPQSRELLIQLVIKSVIYCRHMQIE